MRDRIACVDFGGTKIRTAVITAEGEMLGQPVTVPTEARRPPERILASIVDSIREACGAAGVPVSELRGVGIGSPGPLDLDRGIILHPINLPTLHQFPLKDILERELGIPVAVNNDANVFVLGEAVFGAGKGARIVYGVTLGTGFGSGFVIDGRIYAGATGTAAEIWCFAYRDSIIEDYVSGRAVEAFYRNRTGETLEPRRIADRARDGDGAAREAWGELGRHLGIALSYVVNVVDPEIVVVGGSMASQWDLFVEEMEKAFRPHVNEFPRARCRIVPALLGDLAPLLGAAGLVVGRS